MATDVFVPTFLDSFGTPTVSTTPIVRADNFNVPQPTGTPIVRADNFNTPSAAISIGPATSFVATPRNASADTTWVPSAGVDPALLSYVIVATGSNGIIRTYRFNARSSALLMDLTNSVTWTLVMTVTYLTGTSPPVAATVTPTSGSGVGVAGAVYPDPFSPLAPVLVTVVPSDGAIQANWTAPVDDGGRPITNYVLIASGGGTTRTVVVSDGLAVQGTIGSLDNDVLYTVTVSAGNVVGVGPASNALTATPTSGLPGVDPPPTDGGGPPVPILAPSIQAFIQTETFIPANWIGG